MNARQIAPYLTGWERTLTEKGDVATFQRGDFTIHLIGKKDVRLTGRGIDKEMRFYQAAITVMKRERKMKLFNYLRKLSLPARVALVSALAIVAIVIALTACASSPGSITSHGSIELTTTPLLSGGTYPSDMFPDVAPGGEVTVIDSSGKVIGTSTLTQGPESYTSLLDADFLNFTVTVPSGLPRYGIEIGQNRGTVWFTPAQMKAGPGLSLEG